MMVVPIDAEIDDDRDHAVEECLQPVGAHDLALGAHVALRRTRTVVTTAAMIIGVGVSRSSGIGRL
jgi:hypothetical protein